MAPKLKTDLHGLRACILAGGLGLRLRTVTGDRPKALALVAGQPFLSYVLSQLAASGIRRVTLCTGYGSAAVRSFAGDGSRWGLDISEAEETEPLGTAGAVRQALERFDDRRLLVLNADSFFDVPLARLVARHDEARADATLAVRETDEAGRFGSVVVGEAGEVRAFREKAEMGRAVINGGIYVLERSTLSALSPGQPASLERDVFPAMAADRHPGASRPRLVAAPFDGFFIDIGVPADYDRINRDPSPILQTLGAGLPC